MIKMTDPYYDILYVFLFVQYSICRYINILNISNFFFLRFTFTNKFKKILFCYFALHFKCNFVSTHVLKSSYLLCKIQI